MPEIPQFNGGQRGLLPDLPAPVLDRERRPRVDASGYVSGIDRVKREAAAATDAAMQPLVPQDIFAGEARGNEALARGIQHFAGAMQELAIRKQEAKDYADLTEAETTMDLEYAGFEKWRSQNLGAPDTWEGEWNRRVDALGQKLAANKSYSPQMKEKLNNSFMRFRGQSAIQVATNGTKATLARGAAAADAKFQLAYQNRDKAGMIQAAAEEQQFTGAPSEVGALKVQEGIKSLNAKDRDDFIALDPRTFRDYLKMPRTEWPDFMQDMSDAEAVDADRKAEVSIEQGKASVIATLQESMSNGELRDPNDVWRKRSVYDPQGYLTDDDVEKLMALVKLPKDANNPAMFEKAHAEIAAYSAKDDVSGLQRAQMSTRYATAFKGPMEQELQKQLKEQAERTQAAGMDDFDAEYNRALSELDKMFEDGEFGHFKVPVANISWDQKQNSWVRARDQWEGDGPPIPVRLSQEDSRKITAGAFNDKDGKPKAEVLIDDINARDKAARQVEMKRWSLKKRWTEGKYPTATGMMDEFKASIEQPTKEAARLKLPTWDTVPGNPLLPIPQQQSLPPMEQRKALLNKYAPAR